MKSFLLIAFTFTFLFFGCEKDETIIDPPIDNNPKNVKEFEGKTSQNENCSIKIGEVSDKKVILGYSLTFKKTPTSSTTSSVNNSEGIANILPDSSFTITTILGASGSITGKIGADNITGNFNLMIPNIMDTTHIVGTYQIFKK